MSDVKPSAINAISVMPLSSSTQGGHEQQVLMSGKQQDSQTIDQFAQVKTESVTESTRSVHSQQAVDIENKPEAIEEAVSDISDYVQSIQRDLHFSVDEDSGLTVVRVRDKESGELIRQIPEDVFLNLAQKLKENQPIHLFDAHG